MDGERGDDAALEQPASLMGRKSEPPLSIHQSRGRLGRPYHCCSAHDVLAGKDILPLPLSSLSLCPVGVFLAGARNELVSDDTSKKGYMTARSPSTGSQDLRSLCSGFWGDHDAASLL